MDRFTDRIAVVTGAASGIGRALSIALARRGCDLALADINPEGLAETAREVQRQGRRATTYEVDVADLERMRAFAVSVEQDHGRVDILINNAGVSVAANFEDHSIEDFEWVVGINLWGVIYGCKLFLPLLQRQDEAAIVNLSSMFGLVGVPSQTSYCATKFAVRGFSEALASELATTNVQVMSVHPGGIATNIVKAARYRGAMTSRRDKAIEFFDKRAMSPEKAADQIIAGIASNKLRLLVTPEAHVADVISRMFPVASRRVVNWVQGRLL